jgi:hypothetical protein
MKKTILTISDGNGVDTIFKKWPFYLKLLTAKTTNVINRSVIGASNELMFMILSEALLSEHIDYCIIQWSIASRVDVVADNFWINQAEKDPIYHFNLINNNNKTWWVTSASKNEYIRRYHDCYIQEWQAAQRSQSFIMAAAELLKFHNVKFVFSLCYNMDFLEPTKNILDSYSWAWHEKNCGLSEFRHLSQFKEFDENLSQPHTTIHLEWVDKVLKPNCEFVNYPNTVYNNLEQALLKICLK